uniref:(northern house mosquito) hypothetical protein n=1 Tax=Culex pipiens TaxID=7175 RepID=A0A8D8K2L8_CULPI
MRNLRQVVQEPFRLQPAQEGESRNGRRTGVQVSPLYKVVHQGGSTEATSGRSRNPGQWDGQVRNVWQVFQQHQHPEEPRQVSTPEADGVHLRRLLERLLHAINLHDPPEDARSSGRAAA